MLSNIDPNNWTISEPQPGTKGGKTCLISQDNKPITINLGQGAPLSTPFGAHAFDDAQQTRVNLDLQIPAEVAETFEAIDKWLIAYGIKHKEDLFPKKRETR